MKRVQIFLSTVSAEFKSYRDELSKMLNRPNVTAKVQENFIATGTQTLDKLDDYIQACDAVIHLAGDMTGAFAAPSAIASIKKRYPDLAERLPALRVVMESGDPPLSYTQWEAYLAVYHNKTLLIATPEPGAQRDETFQKNDAECRLQKEHLARLAALGRFTEIHFANADKLAIEILRGPLNDILGKLPSAEDKLARAVSEDFPTPLALLHSDCIGSQQPNPHILQLFIAESLRFISLLALHDSAVYRILGCQSADTKQRIQVLARPERLSDWHSLLRLACPEEGPRCGARFIPEFAGWEARNVNILSKAVQASDVLYRGRFSNLHELAANIRENMSSILAELAFLRRYILLAVTEANPETGNCAAHILRGLVPRSFVFVRDPESPLQPQKSQLYLLNLDRRRALCLTPSLSCVRPEPDLRVYGWGGIADLDGVLQSELLPFNDHEGITVAEQPDTRATLANWIGEELCQCAFGFCVQGGVGGWTGKLLDDNSWEMFQKAVFPAGGEPSVLGRRFRLESAPIHRGLHADVFEAIDIVYEQMSEGAAGKPTTSPTHPVVHVLRAEGAADEEVKEWFENRARCWRQTQYHGVLRLYEPDDPAGKTGAPFLLTEHVANARSLEQLVQSGESLPDKMVLEAATLAAEACRVAHQKDVFLLAFPLRHFLLDGNGNLYLTGFEAAFNRKAGGRFPPSFQQHLRRFSKELTMPAPERMTAPELEHENGVFSAALDVFAVGALLQALRGLSVKPLPDGDKEEERDSDMWKDWRSDPWKCFVYHCLARDPDRRFQSIDQCSKFFQQCAGKSSSSPMVPPELVPLQDGFSITRFPVMNFEFEYFCRVSRRMPPTRTLGFRYCGPFAPVVNVSLRDAKEYCKWLTASDPAAGKWRLPSKAEWLFAATEASTQGFLFPWGNEPPTRERANFYGEFHGPTVVGAHSSGCSWNGCHDLSGNVWEWCQDRFSGEPKRVLKGGSYASPQEDLNLAVERTRLFSGRYNDVGFRLIKEET